MTPKKLHYIFESAMTASPDPLCKNRAEANFRPSKCRRWAKLGISVRTLQNWEIARNMPRGFGLGALLKVISPR